MQEKKRYHGMSWEAWYDLAKQYYEEHGNLLVPRVYAAGDYKLGRWIERQRAAYNGKVLYSGLNEERIKKLDEIGMVWRLEVRESWDTWYALAKAYYQENGHLRVPGGYQADETHRLGNWIREQRKRKKLGQLGKDRIKRLDAIGMNWQISEVTSWEEWYGLAKAYYEENGDLRVPTKYVTEDGKRLGQWICVQRERRKHRARSPLSEEEIRCLDEIGMIWNIKDEWNAEWDEILAQLHDFIKNEGRLPAGSEYVLPNGRTLSAWVSIQKGMAERGQMRKDRRSVF